MSLFRMIALFVVILKTNVYLHTVYRQLQENYRRKNGDGLSLTFLLIWLAGDLFNLAGIIMEKLMFTMVTMTTACQMCYMSLKNLSARGKPILVSIGSLVHCCRYWSYLAGGLLPAMCHRRDQMR